MRVWLHEAEKVVIKTFAFSLSKTYYITALTISNKGIVGYRTGCKNLVGSQRNSAVALNLIASSQNVKPYNSHPVLYPDQNRVRIGR